MIATGVDVWAVQRRAARRLAFTLGARGVLQAVPVAAWLLPAVAFLDRLGVESASLLAAGAGVTAVAAASFAVAGGRAARDPARVAGWIDERSGAGGSWLSAFDVATADRPSRWAPLILGEAAARAEPRPRIRLTAAWRTVPAAFLLALAAALAPVTPGLAAVSAPWDASAAGQAGGAARTDPAPRPGATARPPRSGSPAASVKDLESESSRIRGELAARTEPSPERDALRAQLAILEARLQEARLAAARASTETGAAENAQEAGRGAGGDSAQGRGSGRGASTGRIPEAGHRPGARPGASGTLAGASESRPPRVRQSVTRYFERLEEDHGEDHE